MPTHPQSIPRCEAGVYRPAGCEAGVYRPAGCEAGVYGATGCEAGVYGATGCEAGVYGATGCEAGVYRPAGCEAGVPSCPHIPPLGRCCPGNRRCPWHGNGDCRSRDSPATWDLHTEQRTVTPALQVQAWWHDCSVTGS